MPLEIEIKLKLDSHEAVRTRLAAGGVVRECPFEEGRGWWGLGGWLVGRVTLAVFWCFVVIEGVGEEAVGGVQGRLGLGNVPAHREGYAKMVAGWLKERGVRELRF